MSSPSRFARLSRLFDSALDLPPEHREAWLREQAGDDPTLVGEALAMLAAHDETGVLDRKGPAVSFQIEAWLSAALQDRYQIERELGSGGMATVFLAHEHKHGRPVVIKVLKPEIADRFGAGRFMQEVHIAARLQHPYILGLIDSGDAAGLLYYIMPYVEGETLRARLATRGPLPLDEARELLSDIAEALAYAHGSGVVHRDLKPDNILVAGGHAYLMDFGIAKLIAENSAAWRHTDEGTAIGTPEYMPPEQRLASHALDHRADLWAWGLLAHEMLLNVHPLPGQPLTLRSQRPEIPPALEDAIRACLSPDPARRPASAADLLPLLLPSAERSAEQAPANRRRVMFLTGAVAAALATAAVLASRGAAPSRETPPMPLAVAALRNETGDSALGTWGRLAGDWITQGLQETGRGNVVPWSTALRASERLAAERAAGRNADPLRLLRQETGAGTIVSGAVYRVGDSLQFTVDVTDVVAGRQLQKLPPVSAPISDPQLALEPLRERVMGALAALTDERLARLPGVRQRPPTFPAYQAFERGLRAFLNQDYRGSVSDLRLAHTLDTTFIVPSLYAATAYWNEYQFDSAAALYRTVAARRATLNHYEQLWTDYLGAVLSGDGIRAHTFVRQAAELAPNSRMSYSLAVAALSIDRPAEALATLEKIDPDRGDLRGWSSYWTQLTHALHLTGAHDREREAARALRMRFPDRRVGLVLEVRAVAADGDTAAVEALLAQGEALAPATYWSQAAALVTAGEELIAHGRPASGRRYLERAIQWCHSQLEVVPGYESHRYWLGSALYDLGRWQEAAPIFQELRQEFPARLDYQGLAVLARARLLGKSAGDAMGDWRLAERGRHTFFRARLAAVNGDIDRALALVGEAVAAGVDGLPWMHAAAYNDLELLGARRTSLPQSLRATPAR